MFQVFSKLTLIVASFAVDLASAIKLPIGVVTSVVLTTEEKLLRAVTMFIAFDELAGVFGYFVDERAFALEKTIVDIALIFVVVGLYLKHSNFGANLIFASTDCSLFKVDFAAFAVLFTLFKRPKVKFTSVVIK